MLESNGGVGRPLEDLFGPVHPHVVVHPAEVDHLHLRSVPELVIGLAALHLRERVLRIALVSRMFVKGLLRPGLGALDGVVVRHVLDEVD